ncbi:MAG: pre-peptidase C-terminal domain-containing protein [Chloroflexi bacterium]|nr:pre-peptidase C-terminal domain-containing protein [Chloroflexota bacterium]MCH8160675.1 pre-peptidase C-terminal domain-containing protein [Chloroflexota bacterium]
MLRLALLTFALAASLTAMIVVMAAPAGAGPTPCADDGLEDDDTPAAATTIGLPFNNTSLIVCEFDDDWFAFALNEGQQIRVDATFVHSPDDDVDMFLYGPDGAQVALAIGGADNEVILHTAQDGGTYTLRVSLFVSDGPRQPPRSTEYELTIVKLAGEPTPAPPSGTPEATPTPSPTLPAGSIVVEKLIRILGTDNAALWPPGPGWEMRLFAGSGCQGDPVMTDVTGEDGRVTFAVPPGEYSMAEVMRDGWERTSETSCQDGFAPPGERLTRTFVNRRIPNGDVNGDGLTNAIDSVLLLQISAGLLPRDALAEVDRGDVNDDGEINALDAALVLQFEAGLIDRLPTGAS